MVKVELCNATAKLPTRGTEKSAGLDLWGVDKAGVKTGCIAKVPIYITIELPERTYGRIAPRSRLASTGFFVNGGVVDKYYRGEVSIIFHNTAKEDFVIEAGRRIAQLVLEHVSHAECIEAAKVPKTTEGLRGFGNRGSFPVHGYPTDARNRKKD